MEASKLFLFFIFLPLIFARITAGPPPPNDAASAESADSSLRLQLQLLQIKVSLLESSIDEKDRELRKKDESIRQMEKIIQEKSNSIALIQSEIESVQGRESLDVVELTDKSHVQDGGLAKQEEMMKEKFGISSIFKYLTEAPGRWLPHTLAVHIGYFQSYIVTYWNELGRPAMDVAIEKALEMKDEVKVWAKLYIERIRTKWIPSLKKQGLAFIAYLEPNILLVARKTADVYHSSKGSIAPLFFKVQKIADPYIQEAKKLIEPYVDQVAMVTRPHVEKVRVVLKPCATKVLHAYRKFITTASFYHHEVEEILKKNEVTQPLASMELAWFAATALLALPAVFMFKLYSAIFRKKMKKRSRSTHAKYTGRRLKRAHPEN